MVDTFLNNPRFKLPMHAVKFTLESYRTILHPHKHPHHFVTTLTYAYIAVLALERHCSRHHAMPWRCEQCLSEVKHHPIGAMLTVLPCWRHLTSLQSPYWSSSVFVIFLMPGMYLSVCDSILFCPLTSHLDPCVSVNTHTHVTHTHVTHTHVTHTHVTHTHVTHTRHLLAMRSRHLLAMWYVGPHLIITGLNVRTWLLRIPTPSI